MHTGNRLKVIQEHLEVSNLDISTALNVAPQIVSRWRQMGDLKLSVVVRLCSALGITIEEFCDDTRYFLED